MSTQDNGGPAFPSSNTPDTGYYAEGATLRDYFAAHEPINPDESIGIALAERLIGRAHPTPRNENGTFTAASDPVLVAIFWADAEAAYRYLRADAMLRARQS